jgi:hypothetical protein
MGDYSTVVDAPLKLSIYRVLVLKSDSDILKLTLVHPSFSLTHLQSKPGQLMKKAL